MMYLQSETEEKSHQPEIKLGAIAHTRHKARLRNAKLSQTKNLKPTHGAQNHLSREPGKTTHWGWRRPGQQPQTWGCAQRPAGWMTETETP
jgi:hypothetical protein